LAGTAPEGGEKEIRIGEKDTYEALIKNTAEHLLGEVKDQEKTAGEGARRKARGRFFGEGYHGSKDRGKRVNGKALKGRAWRRNGVWGETKGGEDRETNTKEG